MSAPLPQTDELVAVAHVNSRGEAQIIQALLEDGGIPSLLQQLGPDGPTLGFGLLNPDGGFHRVMVHAGRSEEARALLTKAAVDSEREASPESANARYLEEAQGGRKPRAYGLIGAYARIYAVSLVAMATMFGAYLLYRSL